MINPFPISHNLKPLFAISHNPKPLFPISHNPQPLFLNKQTISFWLSSRFLLPGSPITASRSPTDGQDHLVRRKGYVQQTDEEELHRRVAVTALSQLPDDALQRNRRPAHETRLHRLPYRPLRVKRKRLSHFQPLDVHLRRLICVVDLHFLHDAISLEQRAQLPVSFHNYPSTRSATTHRCR